MGYHITIIDTQEDTTETVYFSSFLPARHIRWYNGDPMDCFCYFHEGTQMLGSPGSDDLSGEWEPDWDFCLKMTYRTMGYLDAYDITTHPNYSEETRSGLEACLQKDQGIYEQILGICQNGVSFPGRFLVRMSY